MSSEISQHASFSYIRYAQCWEDADILLEALAIQPGDTCVAIASAGDNALAMLTQQPERVVALDLSKSQLACLELRVAAYRELNHAELLELLGSKTSQQRPTLYQRCRPLLSSDVRDFWDSQGKAIEAGIGGAGKFERYFATFRKRVLPLIHGHKTVMELMENKSQSEREEFYRKCWDSWRWQALFRLFFSRFVMGRMGRDPSFFRYVEGSVAKRILGRAKYALTTLNPAENPYLQWILTGQHLTALPLALRPEHFDNIRERLDHLEIKQCSLEDYLAEAGPKSIARYNLSDIFEYMSADAFQALLERLIEAGIPGGRLAYWNMLVPRQRPEVLAAKLEPLDALAQRLHQQDKAFFYSQFIVEEICR